MGSVEMCETLLNPKLNVTFTQGLVLCLLCVTFFHQELHLNSVLQLCNYNKDVHWHIVALLLI